MSTTRIRPRPRGYTRRTLRTVSVNWDLYLMLLLPVAFFIIFAYAPMFGLQIAFKDYRMRAGIWGSSWVGLKHFQRFMNTLIFRRVLGNTISLSLYSLTAGFPMPILLALMMNELRSVRFKKTVQLITYAPHFLSTVVLVGMLQVMLQYPSQLILRGGIINNFLMMLGGQPVKFLESAAWFPHLYVWSGIWQNMGWGSIIYMAALAGIDQELYEAAMVDGASKLQRLLYITLPSLIPTAVVLFILDTGKIMNIGFEKVYLLQNQFNLSKSQVISTYVYDVGLLGGEYSYSTAVNLFNSLINLALIITVNAISKRVSETSLW